MNPVIYQYIAPPPRADISLIFEYTEGGRTESMVDMLNEIKALPEVEQ